MSKPKQTHKPAWEVRLFTYNPYKAATFVDCFTGAPVVAASRVLLTLAGSFAEGAG